MKLKIILLLLFFPVLFYSQTLCDSLGVDFPFRSTIKISISEILYRYVLLFFFFGIASTVQGQVETIPLSQVNNRLDDRVLIEGCDTFKISINFYSGTSTMTPYLVTREGSADIDDYWTNMPDSMWVTIANPILDIEIYPIQENIEEEVECIFYKIENIGAGYLNTINLKVYDEFPDHFIEVASGDDDSETMCENDNDASINIFPSNEDNVFEDNRFEFEGPISLFEDDTIEYVYIDISGVDDCYLFDDLFRKVCFSVNYPNTENLKVTLRSPDNKSILLYDGEIAVQIMSQSCFTIESNTPIEDGESVYFGNFIASGGVEGWENIRDAEINGVWTMIFETNTIEIQGECSDVRIYLENQDTHHFSYKCDWFSDESDISEFVYSSLLTLDAGDFNIEVLALNCTYDLSTTIYERNVRSLDTMICRNSTTSVLGHVFTHPEDSHSTLVSNTSSNNCDSLYTINVTYQPFHYDLDFQLLGEGESILVDTMPVSEAGIYSVIYESEEGCDSLFHTVVVPTETLAIFHTIPDFVTGTSVGCEAGVCIPFLSDFYGSFDYFVDGELLDASQISLCETPLYDLYSLSIDFSDFDLFPIEQQFRVTNLIIDGELQQDFCIADEEDFVHVLNYYMPNLGLIMGPDFQVYAARSFDISCSFEELSSGSTYFFGPSVNPVEFVNAGVFIAMSEGQHEVKIKHKYSDKEKMIIANLEEHAFPETDTITLDYLGQLNQTVSFFLPATDLCGEIVSAVEKCSEVSSDVVDYSLTNQGLLSFKSLTENSFQICIEVCDEKGVCQIVVLSVDFENEMNEEEEEIDLTRNLFPNPAQTILHFVEPTVSSLKQINVYDSTGRQIEKIKLDEVNVFDLDVSRYAEGFYIAVRHLENGEVFVEKFVVQR